MPDTSLTGSLDPGPHAMRVGRVFGRAAAGAVEGTSPIRARQICRCSQGAAGGGGAGERRCDSVG